MMKLQEYPGWKEWKRKQIGHTLNFDDPFPVLSEVNPREFKFTVGVEKQHSVVVQYLGLQATVVALKQCEFYFRRYPFRGLPVSRYDHATNVCEMYFNRFYEFKERLKNYSEAVSTAAPAHDIELGALVRTFRHEFAAELRERNFVHHHRRFEDLALDRVFLTESMAGMGGHWDERHLAAYRRFTNEWVRRVRRRGERMDEFLEAIASATLAVCSFLSTDQVADSGNN